MTRQATFSRLLLYLIIIIGAIPLLLPFFWLISSSLKTYNRVYHYPPEWLPITENYYVKGDTARPLRVNIIDKNEDTQTGVFRVRITGSADNQNVYLPSRLKHPQFEVLTKNVKMDITTHHTIRLFRQNIIIDVVEKGKQRSLIRVISESDPFEISLSKLKLHSDSSVTIKMLEKSIPVQVIRKNKKAGIALVKLMPSSILLPIDNRQIYEARITDYFIQKGTEKIPVEWVKRSQQNELSLVARLDQPLILELSPRDIKQDTQTTYFTQLYGQKIMIKPIEQQAPNGMIAVKFLDPVSLDASLVKVERKFAPQWKNYVDVLKKEPFHYYVLNTLFIALCSILGQIVSCSLVGYGFARLRFPGRNLLFIILLSSMMLPQQIILIPQFILYVKLGWLDSFKPLIVPTFLAQSAFFVFLFRQYFMTISYDLEDAARIDGCSPLYSYWHIMLPLSKPVIVTVAVYTFMWTWNDFLYPLLYLNSDEYQTLALALQNFKTAFGLRDPHLLMAASTMMIMPSIMLFFFAQRAFIRGVVITGVKG